MTPVTMHRPNLSRPGVPNHALLAMKRAVKPSNLTPRSSSSHGLSSSRSIALATGV